MKKKMYLIIVLVFTILLIGCNSSKTLDENNSDNKLVGKWERTATMIPGDKDGNIELVQARSILHFLDNERFTEGNAFGKYELIDTESILVTIENGDKQYKNIWYYSISRDVLKLRKDSTIFIYNKVNNVMEE